jgi:cell division protease FtsH
MRLVEEARRQARRILVERHTGLEVLAKGLLEYETLSGHEIKNLLAGKPPVRKELDAPLSRPSTVPSIGSVKPRPEVASSEARLEQ